MQSLPYEAKEPSAVGMNRDLEVGVLEIDSCHPGVTANHRHNCPYRFHPESGGVDIPVSGESSRIGWKPPVAFGTTKRWLQNPKVDEASSNAPFSKRS